MRLFARLLCVSTLLLLLATCQAVQTPDARRWGTAEFIGNMREESLRPDVAVDPDFNAMAVWDEADQPESREDIWSNRFAATSESWGVGQRIEMDDAGAAVFPRVAMDRGGNAVVVWRQSNGSWQDIWSNRYTAATGEWGDAELIEEDDGEARSPEVAVDGDGNAVAVWYQSDEERFNIWSNRYTAATGEWGTADPIEDVAGNAIRPQVAVDPSGNAVAVWEQSSDRRVIVYSNRSTPDGVWGAARPIDADHAGDAKAPQVAVDAGGNAVAVWQQFDGARDSIWSNRYPATDASWVGAELIETDDRGDAQRPEVAMDPNGNAVAVWSQFDGTNDDIWSNHYSSGGVWHSAERIEATDTGEALRPRVAMDASGSAVVVWIQPDGSQDSIWSNRYTPSFGWGNEEPIETFDGGRAVQPEVAMEPKGNAVAVWTQRTRGNDQIWSNRLEWPDLD